MCLFKAEHGRAALKERRSWALTSAAHILASGSAARELKNERERERRSWAEKWAQTRARLCFFQKFMQKFGLFASKNRK